MPYGLGVFYKNGSKIYVTPSSYSNREFYDKQYTAELILEIHMIVYVTDCRTKELTEIVNINEKLLKLKQFVKGCPFGNVHHAANSLKNIERLEMNLHFIKLCCNRIVKVEY